MTLVPLKKYVVLTVGMFPFVGCGSGAHQEGPVPDAKFADSTFEPPQGSTLLPGRGYNSIQGDVMGSCVERGQMITRGGNGQKVTFALRQLSSLEELHEALQLSVAASYGKGLFKASAKSSYFRSTDMSSFSSYLMVSVQVENQTQILADYRYTPEARQLLLKSRSEFLARCGDEFVSAVTTGGDFTAVVEFRAKTLEQKEKVEAQLRVSGGTYSGSADFSRSMQSLSKMSDLQVSVLRSGGTGSVPKLEELVQAAMDFPNKVGGSAAWPISVSTTSYDAVVDAGAHRPVNLRQQQTFLEDLMKSRMILLRLKNDVLSVLHAPQRFPDADLPELKAVLPKINDELVRLENMPRRCFDNPEDPANCIADHVNIPNVKMPALVVNINAACQFRRDYYFRHGKISKRDYDYYNDTNQIPVIGRLVVSMSCEEMVLDLEL